MLTEARVEEKVYERYISDTGSEFVTFVELGAAHGFQSTKFSACVERLKSVTAVKRVFYVLVEAYPPHFPYLDQNWKGRDCKIIYGAVAERSGTARFLTEWEGCSGKDFWGGAITKLGELEVRTYTLYEIMEIAGIDHISFLHMDIQGSEGSIVEHCADLSLGGKLENVYVGTHGHPRHEHVREKLSPYMPLKIDAPPKSVSPTPLGDVQTADGILFFSHTLDLSRTESA